MPRDKAEGERLSGQPRVVVRLEFLLAEGAPFEAGLFDEAFAVLFDGAFEFGFDGFPDWVWGESVGVWECGSVRAWECGSV